MIDKACEGLRAVPPTFDDKNHMLTLEKVEIEAFSCLFATALPQVISTEGGNVMTVGSATAMVMAEVDVLAFNRVVGLGADGPIDDALLDDIISIYERAGVGRFFIQLSPVALQTSLSDLLIDRGFVHHNNWVKLHRRLKPIEPIETILRVEEISADQAELFGRIVVDNFEWPRQLVASIAGTVDRRNWRHYMAFDGDRPVATGAMYIKNEYGWIDLAATLENYRGRGAQASILTQRIYDASRAGCRWLVAETAEETPDRSVPSYRNMVRYGFEVAYIRPNYLYSF